MADRSSIEWTDASWNPVRGCSRVSEGCRNCYAERIAVRFSGPGQPYEGLASRASGQWTGKVRLIESVLDKPHRWRKPRRVFVNSMSDLFHGLLGIPYLYRILDIIAATPRHVFQVLTKRPFWMRELVGEWCEKHGAPPPNLWLGVSVENQRYADERIPELLGTPAAVRWVSVEPLLGLVDLAPYLPQLDWIVVGCESGPGARPMSEDWVRVLRDQCVEAGVPFFFKQQKIAGKVTPMPYLDGRQWEQYPRFAAAGGRPRSDRVTKEAVRRRETRAKRIPPWSVRNTDW